MESIGDKDVEDAVPIIIRKSDAQSLARLREGLLCERFQ